MTSLVGNNIELVYGSFLYDQCQIPFISGCMLPAISRSSMSKIRFEVKAECIMVGDQAGVNLHFFIYGLSSDWFNTQFIANRSYPDFLDALSKSSVIYLLGGIPMNYEFKNRNQFFRQMSENGYGFSLAAMDRARIAIRNIEL